MITKEQAVNADYSACFEHVSITYADKKTLIRARVNGKCKVWKTRPEEFKLPMKYGIYDCFHITQDNANEWSVIK